MILYQYLQIGENSAHVLEVKASHLGNDSFRVEADGVTMHVTLAVYTKVNAVSNTIFMQLTDLYILGSLLSSICSDLYILGCHCFLLFAPSIRIEVLIFYWA